MPSNAEADNATTALAKNHALYGDLWRHYQLFPHDGWSSWPEIAPYAQGPDKKRLEIGPGMFPHLPIAGTCFADLSMIALTALAGRGGHCLRATVPLPFPDASFDVVCMFEVLEHVDDDRGLMREVQRVLRPGGMLFFSCPMNPSYWTYYDSVMGHVRRYQGAELRGKLADSGLVLERLCARDDRMPIWFGTLFGIGMRYLPGFTAIFVRHYLPKVAGLPWVFKEGDALGDALKEAERRGGITGRARRV